MGSVVRRVECEWVGGDYRLGGLGGFVLFGCFFRVTFVIDFSSIRFVFFI